MEPFKSKLEAFNWNVIQIDGHNHEAIRLHQGLSEIIKAMFITTNPIPVKYAARKIGLPVGEFNLPMCEPTADEAAYIDKALTEYLQ